jgi:hypothetical protein
VRFVNGVPFSVLAKIAAEVAQDFFWSEWFAGCHVQTPSEKRYGAAVGAAPIRGTKRPWVAQFLHIFAPWNHCYNGGILNGCSQLHRI